MKNDRALLVLAGGLSTRMGTDKTMMPFLGKPMYQHALASAQRTPYKIYVSVRDHRDAEKLRPLTPNGQIIVDKANLPHSPLSGIVSTAQHINEQQTFVFPADSPIVNPDLVDYIFHFLNRFDCCVPMWPDGTVEAIHAAYNTQTLRTPIAPNIEVRALPRLIKNTLFIGTETLKQIDETLISLKDIDTPQDLQSYIQLMYHRPQETHSSQKAL